MRFFGALFTSGVLEIWIISWWFIALVYLILKPIEKIDTGMKVKRADLSAKQ
jgi:hypothetical protein